MRVSSTRMTFEFLIQYLAVVAGLDPATHEWPDPACVHSCVHSPVWHSLPQPNASPFVCLASQWLI